MATQLLEPQLKHVVCVRATRQELSIPRVMLLATATSPVFTVTRVTQAHCATSK